MSHKIVTRIRSMENDKTTGPKHPNAGITKPEPPYLEGHKNQRVEPHPRGPVWTHNQKEDEPVATIPGGNGFVTGQTTISSDRLITVDEIDSSYGGLLQEVGQFVIKETPFAMDVICARHNVSPILFDALIRLEFVSEPTESVKGFLFKPGPWFGKVSQMALWNAVSEREKELGLPVSGGILPKKEMPQHGCPEKDVAHQQPAQKPDRRETPYPLKAIGMQFNDAGVLDPLSGPGFRALYGAADIIDEMDRLRKTTDDPELRRLASVAITLAQQAAWAVKAATEWSKLY